MTFLLPELVVDRFRCVSQSVRILIECAGHALRLVDPRQGECQPFFVLLLAEVFESRVCGLQRGACGLEMAARVPEVDSVEVQARIEHCGAPFEQAVAQFSGLECALDGRTARGASHPSHTERNEQRHADSKNELHRHHHLLRQEGGMFPLRQGDSLLQPKLLEPAP